MGKKRKAPGEKSCHTRPENAASAPEAEDHERYYSQNAALQLDMGSLATAQLGLQAPSVSGLVADLGCGSGLSAAALGRQAGVGGWIGTDITSEMVGSHAHGPAREPEPATSTYRLRTRSASLRAAWMERPIKQDEEGSEEGREVALGTADSGSLAAAEEEGMEEGSTGAEEEPRRPPARKPARRPAPRAAARAKAAAAKTAAAAAAPAASAAAKPADSAGAEAADGSDDEGQKRLGRPLAYQGDPNSPELADAERRKIKRRIANRESARRVRAKRAELLEELQIKVTALTQQNGQLASHCAVMESQRNMLLQHNALLQQKLSQKGEETVSLLNQVFALRRLVAPENAAQAELAAQAEREALAGTPPPHSPLPMQGEGEGTGMFMPLTPHALAGGHGGEGADDPLSADVQGLNFL